MKKKVLFLLGLLISFGTLSANQPENNEILPYPETPLFKVVVGYAGGYEIYTKLSVFYQEVDGMKIPVAFAYVGAGLYGYPIDIITEYHIDSPTEWGVLYYSGTYTYKTPSGSSGTKSFYISISDIVIPDEFPPLNQ